MFWASYRFVYSMIILKTIWIRTNVLHCGLSYATFHTTSYSLQTHYSHVGSLAALRKTFLGVSRKYFCTLHAISHPLYIVWINDEYSSDNYPFQMISCFFELPLRYTFPHIITYNPLVRSSIVHPVSAQPYRSPCHVYRWYPRQHMACNCLQHLQMSVSEK